MKIEQVVEAFQPQPSTSSSMSSISSFGGSSRPSSSSTSSKKSAREQQPDEVDEILAKLDGRLDRKRDPKLCRHNSNGCCVHCSPIEPFDEEYLKEHKIKHLSFHSYIRKLTSGVDRGKFVALEDLVRDLFVFCLTSAVHTIQRYRPDWPFVYFTGVQHQKWLSRSSTMAKRNLFEMSTIGNYAESSNISTCWQCNVWKYGIGRTFSQLLAIDWTSAYGFFVW